MHAILISHPPYGPYDLEQTACNEAGWTLEIVPPGALALAPRRADVVLNANADRVDASLLEATACRVALGYGVGLDWIDLAAARQRGVQIIRMPLANVPDVALHALALILACERRLVRFDRAIRRDTFDPSPALALHRPAGRTLGLLAFGNIPRALAGYAHPLGYRILAYDPGVSDDDVLAHGVEPVATIEDLLSRSDTLSVHVPSTSATRGLLDARRLALLPHGATVVITSRGDVYDAPALAAALWSGAIGSAGLDVLPDEPPPPDDPLIAAPNAILTPHIAGTSAEAVQDLHTAACAVIRAVAVGAPPPGLL